jgi:MFS family permease
MTINTDTRYKQSKLIGYNLVIVAAALIIQMIGWGIFFTFGIFVSQFQQDFHWSRTIISGAASVALLVHGLFSILMGNISDRYGPRIVMTFCSIVMAVGIFLTSRINEIWQLYLFWGIIVGIGASALDVVVLSTIARWFTRNRSVINGMVKSGAGLGQLAFPLVTGALIVSQGWQNTFVVLAVICLVAILTASQFLKRDPGQHTRSTDGSLAKNGQVSAHSEGGVTFRRALHTRQFWAVVLAYAAALFCSFSIQIHITPHAIDLGNSITRAAGMLSVIAITSMIARLVMGSIGDRIGNVKTMTICYTILFISLLSLGLLKQSWALYIILPVFGLSHGGIFSLISPTIAGLFGTGSHGAIYGVIIFGGTIGGAIGPLMAGSIYDHVGNYTLVFFILAAIAACGLGLISILKPVVIKE